MTPTELSAILARLPAGQRRMIPYDTFNGLFAPGIRTSEGRSALYAFANVHGCGIQWDDESASVAFVKNSYSNL